MAKQELVQLIPYLKNKGAKQLGILGKIHSSIASQIDILDATVNKEICTLNLAPQQVLQWQWQLVMLWLWYGWKGWHF